MITVASYGMGRNSKYAIARWVEEGNPLHIVLAADTGKHDAEKKATYADFDKFSEWLMYRGVPCQLVRVTGSTLYEFYLVPRNVAYWCAIRLGAHATYGKWGNESPTDLLFMTALQRWAFSNKEAPPEGA